MKSAGGVNISAWVLVEGIKVVSVGGGGVDFVEGLLTIVH